MKGNLTGVVCFAVVVSIGLPGSPCLLAEEETGILPVPAADLWEAMPGKLKTWNLTRSTAETRLGGWVESRAVREYEKKSVEPGGAGKGKAGGKGKGKAGAKGKKGAPATGPPAKTRIVVTDTGKHSTAIGHFADYSLELGEGEVEEEGVTRRMVGSFPGFVITYGENEQALEFLVAGRFLVEIAIENQPEKFLEEWTRRIDTAALTKIPETEIVPLPDSLIIVKLDQLNPKKNRAYRLATTSNTRLEKELLEDEAWLRKVIGEVPEIPEPEEGEP